MRITLSAFIVLALVGLAPQYAAAQNGSPKMSSYHYETCTCHFGYGNVCTSTVSCNGSGGRCSGSCTPSPYDALTSH
jgi:hypothetical protein